MDDKTTFFEHYTHVRKVVGKAAAHQDLDFHSLGELLAQSRKSSRFASKEGHAISAAFSQVKSPHDLRLGQSRSAPLVSMFPPQALFSMSPGLMVRDDPTTLPDLPEGLSIADVILVRSICHHPPPPRCRLCCANVAVSLA